MQKIKQYSTTFFQVNEQSYEYGTKPNVGIIDW